MFETAPREITLEKKLDSESSAHAAPESAPSPEEAFEQDMRRIETESLRAEQLMHEAQNLAQAMTPEEEAWIMHEMEKTPEGRNLWADLKEKGMQLMRAYHHEEERLSQKYNARTVKAVGLAGKVIGGISGALTGHGIASAAGSVAGSKIGGIGFLKAFDWTVERLPQSLQEKMKTASPEQSIERPENERIDSIKKMEAEIALEQREQAALTELLAQESREIAALSPDERAEFQRLIEEDNDARSVIDRASATYESYTHFYKNFEHKHPGKTAVVEVFVHSCVGPALSVAGVGMEALHLIELFAAGGAAEQLTKPFIKHAVEARDRMRTSLDALQKSIATFTRATPATDVPPQPRDTV